MERREFLASASATALCIPFLNRIKDTPINGKPSKYVDTIGLQLWTVRDQMKQSIGETLVAIKAAGYQQIELGSVIGSEKIVEHAKKIGLKINSSFVDWNAVIKGDIDKQKKIVKQAKKIGLKHLVFGYIGKGHRETVEHMKTAASAANKFGKICSDSGLKLCYHNHSFEFAKIDGDTTGFKILENELDDKSCQFELDVFWAKIAGFDPVKLMKGLRGRVTQVHLKDLKDGTKLNFDEGTVPHEAFEELGDGNIDLKTVMSLAEEIGVEFCHVEQDQSPDPIASIARSINYLKKNG